MSATPESKRSSVVRTTLTGKNQLQPTPEELERLKAERHPEASPLTRDEWEALRHPYFREEPIDAQEPSERLRAALDGVENICSGSEAAIQKWAQDGTRPDAAEALRIHIKNTRLVVAAALQPSDPTKGSPE